MAGLVPAAAQRGAHGMGAAGVTATARVYGLRATSAWLAAFGEQSPAEQGQGRQPARPQGPAESATGWAGSGATPPAPPGRSCRQALVLRSLRRRKHLLPAPSALGALVPAQGSGRLGRTPRPLAGHLYHVTLGKGWSGEMPGIALGLAGPILTARLPPAAQRCGQGRAGLGEAAQSFALAWRAAAAEPA